jgi:hypothetical protein
MTRSFIPKVVTANDLRLGDVVYLTATDQWTRIHSQAELICDEAQAQMRLSHGAAQKLVVVGAYLADAKDGPQGPEPVHFREEFRTRGPSNYAHGKQMDVTSV